MVNLLFHHAEGQTQYHLPIGPKDWFYHYCSGIILKRAITFEELISEKLPSRPLFWNFLLQGLTCVVLRVRGLHYFIVTCKSTLGVGCPMPCNPILCQRCFQAFNPLSAHPLKWSNTLKQFVGC